MGSADLGSLTDDTFEYSSDTLRVTQITASSADVRFRVRSGAMDIESLVLEWAGEVLPFDEATRSGQVFTWSQTWLAANAPALAATNYAATLPEGGRGIVCIREADEACPSTAIATNSPATGAPAISGAAQAGQTLTASLGTVADADGVPATLTWQWVRVDGGSETAVGANSSSYTPVADDVGKTIKVKLSFTDRGGFSEGPLESAATAAVLAAPRSLPRQQRLVRDAHGGCGVSQLDPIHLSSGYQQVLERCHFGELSDTTIELRRHDLFGQRPAAYQTITGGEVSTIRRHRSGRLRAARRGVQPRRDRVHRRQPAANRPRRAATNGPSPRISPGRTDRRSPSPCASPTAPRPARPPSRGRPRSARP